MINLHPHLGPFGWLLSLAKWLYPCDRPRTHKLTPFRPVHVPCFCFDAIDNKESGWKLIAAAQEKKGHDPHENKYPVASQFLELLLQGTPLRSDKDTQLKQQLLKFNIQGNQGNVLSTLLSKEYLNNMWKTQNNKCSL